MPMLLMEKPPPWYSSGFSLPDVRAFSIERLWHRVADGGEAFQVRLGG